ncbi:MAG TPA: GH25 family lysozyme [Polyangia bacterium]|nr:GH25 family lysozyme [Polyangia bacterium]
MVCPANVVEGVDVSDGQGTIDWTKVAGSGRGFAFMKATQGDYFTASTFTKNWSNAKAAGLLRSPYHFFDATIDGVKQANHFLMVVNAAGGFQPGDLPAMLDIECPTSGTQSQASANCEYTGNSGWAMPSVIAQRAFDWLNTVEAATGRKPIIYSYPSWFAGVSFTDPKLAQYPLYIATLAKCASVPPPWTTATFWQYSFTGTVPGITPQVDLDRFVGTAGELTAFANGTTGADGGADDGGGAGLDAGTGASDLAMPAAQDGGKGGNASSGCSCEIGARAKEPLHAPLWCSLLGLWLVRLWLLRRRQKASAKLIV